MLLPNGASRNPTENAFSVSEPIPLVWADERDRPDAAELRLRQVYAELGGMIAAVTSPRGVCYFERLWISTDRGMIPGGLKLS
jgi:hypothetical protein